MKNMGNIVKSLQNIMRKDTGVSGDAQRIEQLGWLIALKILDDKDQELEAMDESGKFQSPIPKNLQWRNWAADDEGITGDALRDFIEKDLFPTLKNLEITKGNRRALIVKEIFEGTNNYMKNGTLLRQVVNQLNQIDFNSSDDRHVFGDIYEGILKGLQSAGNYGEFYTPRALTEFMTEVINPQLDEKLLDPACGTGGFLTCAIEHIRKNEVKTAEDLHTLGANVRGFEFKPLPFMLAVTNLILHDIEVPNIDYTDSLNREYTSITEADRVNVILANPPFGASVTDGVETNYPQTYRTTESADLFLVLMIRLLKTHGRAAIVLPDGSLTGDGVKARIRQHWLETCNLHTIIRLPNSVFQPYASVATNIMFFDKGTANQTNATKEIWYYEHQLPESVKAYSKTKPIQKSEFEPLKAWWGNREASEQAWKVSIDDIRANNYSLDIKNPHIGEEAHSHSSSELLDMLHASFARSDALLAQLKKELQA